MNGMVGPALREGERHLLAFLRDKPEEPHYATVPLVFWHNLPVKDGHPSVIQGSPCLPLTDSAEEHRDTEPVVVSAVPWIERCAREQQPAGSQPAGDARQEAAVTLGGNVPQRVEGSDGIETSWAQHKSGHVCLDQEGLRRSLSCQAQLHGRRVHAYDSMMLAEKPRRRLSGPAAKVHNETVGLQTPKELPDPMEPHRVIPRLFPVSLDGVIAPTHHPERISHRRRIRPARDQLSGPGDHDSPVTTCSSALSSGRGGPRPFSLSTLPSSMRWTRLGRQAVRMLVSRSGWLPRVIPLRCGLREP